MPASVAVPLPLFVNVTPVGSAPVNEIVAAADLMPWALAKADAIVANSPFAVQAVKQQIIRVHQGQSGVAALGTITVVAYDYESGRSISVPAAWRAAIKAYEVIAPAE